MIVVPALHPAFLLRSGDDQGAGMAKFFEATVADVAKAKRLTKLRPDWDESQIWERDSVGRFWRLYPTLEEVWAFVQLAAQNAAQGGVLIGDVETSGDHPMMSKLLCIGLGIVDRSGKTTQLFNVPFHARHGQEYWSPNDRYRVVQMLAWLFSLAPMCFHNGGFDTIVLRAHSMPVAYWHHDTMQALRIADAELPMNLAYLASRKTDGRYWKDDVKGDTAWVDMDPLILRSYNLRDILSTGLCLPQIEQDVRQLHAWQLYQEDIELCRYLARATWRGIAVDESRRLALAGKLKIQRDNALATLRTIAGSNGFDPGKPSHLTAFLFQYLGFPVVKTTKTGKPATDKDAMVLLALYADSPVRVTALQALVDFKSSTKSLSTWVENLGILPDGRIHSSFKNLPVTGRLATSPNVQNLPIAIKKILMAAQPGTNNPTGAKFTGVDLSQAELRMIGYDADDPFLLRMYEQGVNVHTVNCGLFFGVRPPLKDAKDPKKPHKDLDQATIDFMRTELPEIAPNAVPFDQLIECPDSRWKPTRTLSKNGEFGSNYLGTEETLFKVLRAKRDPDTNQLLFPDITLAEVSAILQVKKKARPALMDWQKRVPLEAQAQGFHRCEISGRYRFFRGGFKGTEVTATRIQMGVASHVNKATLKICKQLDQETSGACELVLQVHDALTTEGPDEYAARAGEIMVKTLSEPFPYKRFPKAVLPADKADIGQYLNEV